MTLPMNGAALVDLRRSGVKPEAMVVVSLVGHPGCSNTVLLPDLDALQGIDWTLILGLDVEVMTSTSVPFRQLLTLLRDVADGVPKTMQLTFVEGIQVDLGRSRALPASAQGLVFFLFDWFPTAVNCPRMDAAVALQNRLRREVGNNIPDRFQDAAEAIVQRWKEGKQAWQQ